MPKQVMDYSKCVIYKIVCKDETINHLYVGHTINFTQRMHSHKRCCIYNSQNAYNLKLYQFIREHGGWENWRCVIIEEYPCDNKTQACIREEQLRVELQAQLNSKASYVENQYQRQLELHPNYFKEKYQKEKQMKQAYNKQQHKIEYVCECGWIGNQLSKYCHFKRKSHLDWLDQKA